MVETCLDFDDATTMPFDVHEYRKLIRCVPGLTGMYGMIRSAFDETIRRVLVVGCGGGMEIEELKDYDIVGVDPSEEMLKMVSGSAHLIKGTVRDVPLEEFDAATSILVMHFLTLNDKRSYLDDIHKRLRVGGLFVLVDVSFGEDRCELDRQHQVFLTHATAEQGIDGPTIESAIHNLREMPLLSDAETRHLLTEHGFTVLYPFFRGLWYAGWIAKKLG